jgi:FAD/FMN-containing dehydrogenase
VPFLAITGGHGTATALNSMKGGLGIWLRGMAGTKISGTNSKGSVAVIQGGSLSGEVIEAVWKEGKTLVAGGCDCTGFTAPMLGGGHGWLQGKYGLITDNLLSARVVLANASVITVSSTQHPDLFWGLRGAGHNFGIVTSVNYQVYDRTSDADEGFATASYTFTQDKLEAVFSLANKWIKADHRPVELTHYAIFANAPPVDSKPIINFLVYWQGTSIPSKYTDPLNELKPVNVATSYVDLLGANANTGGSANGSACAEGFSHQTYPVDLPAWNLENLRSTLNIFAELPTVGLGNSVMLLEGFAMNKVQAIDSRQTAFPSRQSNILASPLFTYEAGNATLDDAAVVYGKKIRNTMLKNTGLQLGAYVNYAHGDESQQATYGYETWRLRKLQSLKKAYDPYGKFNFYAPIKI